MRIPLFVLLLGALASGSVSAGLVRVTGSGTWDGTTPSTDISVANQSWSLSFEVDDPTDLAKIDTDFVPVYNGTYSLNGTSVGTLTEVLFLSASFNGMFDLQFASGTSFLSFYGPQIYNGSTGALTIGTVSAAIDVDAHALPTGHGAASIDISAVPEPGSLALVALGMAGLGRVRCGLGARA